MKEKFNEKHIKEGLILFDECGMIKAVVSKITDKSKVHLIYRDGQVADYISKETILEYFTPLISYSNFIEAISSNEFKEL